MRKNFEMSQQQLEKLLSCMTSEPLIMLQCGVPRSAQEKANDAWDRLGDEMGFIGSTVTPNGQGDRFFSAEAKDTQP
jgi:hypothetical protein